MTSQEQETDHLAIYLSITAADNCRANDMYSSSSAESWSDFEINAPVASPRTSGTSWNVNLGCIPHTNSLYINKTSFPHAIVV